MRTVLIAATEADPAQPGVCFTPPCSATDARRLAQASLDQTVEAAFEAAPERVAVVLDPGSPLAVGGVEVVAPEADEEDERIGTALATCSGPTLLVRARTPQLTVRRVVDGLEALDGPFGDAVVGLTVDESWWVLGLAAPDPMALLGLPMRGSGSGTHLLDRLHGLGLAIGLADRLLAAERFDDATAIASEVPGTPFAQLVAELS